MLKLKIAFVLAASSLVSFVATEKDCKAANGFKYAVCGDGLKDADQKCCGTLQKCVQVKPYTGTDLVECSAARQLSNTKAVKIVIIPLFCLILQIAAVAYLALRCKIQESPVTQLCAVVIGLSWPFLFSRFWAFGIYNAFLATIMAVAAAPSVDYTKPLPWWVYRLLWAMALFEIVCLLGPIEAFHVPLFGESSAAAAPSTEAVNTFYDEDLCNSNYDSYFLILDIEKQEKEANPDLKHFGYCSKNWLAAVQSFLVVQALLWGGLLLLSARTFLNAGMGKVKDDAATLISVLPKPSAD